MRGIETLQFSTGAEAVRHQFDAWHAAMEAAIDVSRSADDGQGSGFAASLSAWDLAGVGLVSMRMPGVGYERRWTNVAKPVADHWSLMLPVTDGWNRPYSRRRLHLSSLDRPFAGSGSDTHVVSCFIARDLLSSHASLVNLGEGPFIDEWRGGLLMDLILSLRVRLQEGLVADPAGIRNAVLAIFLSAFAPSADMPPSTRSLVEALWQERILRYIRANLGSARLNVDGICRAFQLSRSRLYRLFGGTDGIDATIRRERVEAARRVLERGDTRRIHRIAEEFGFPDPSSFSRAFRQHAGLTPTEVREGAAAHRTPRLGPLDAFLAGLDTPFDRRQRDPQH